MRWCVLVVSMAACDPCAGASDRASFLLHIADSAGNPASPTVVSVNGNECEEQETGDWYCRRIRPASAYILDISGEGFQYYSEPLAVEETGREECPYLAENEADIALEPADASRERAARRP